MRTCAAILLGLVVGASIALPAGAATTAKPVEVARDGKVTLVAGDEEREVCIRIGPDEPGTSCAESGAGIASVHGVGNDDPLYLGAAVPVAAASIEVRRAGALLASGPTVAGEAYKGVRAGSVRFALVRLAKGAKTDGLRVRALNAAGTLVAVLAPEDEPELELGRTRLLRGQGRDTQWSVFVEQKSELTPSVLDLGHETVTRCVGARVGSVEWDGACAGGPPFQTLNPFDTRTALSAETCDPPFRVVYGVVDGSVGSVVVALGDGRRRTVRTVDVGDGRRAYGLATGSGAVRSVTISSQDVSRPAYAPMSAVCAGGGRGLRLLNFGSSALGLFALFVDVPQVTPTGPVTAIAGSPGIQVADGPADSLCIALAGRPFDGLGCDIVSPLFDDPLSTIDDILNPSAFAVAVPAVVASIRFTGADGKVVRTIPTVADTGYSGRYAGRVRFASGALSSIAELARLELLDAAGTVLYREAASEEAAGFSPPRVGKARRLAGRPGGPTLWQTNARYGTTTDRCLALTNGAPPRPKDNCQASREDATVLLDASCATRRLSVGIAVAAGTRVVADTGSRFRQSVRLRNGAAVLTLRPARPLRALTFIRKQRKRRVEIGAPAGAKQCGWRLRPSVDED